MKKLSLLVLIFLIGCKTSHVSKIDEKYINVSNILNLDFIYFRKILNTPCVEEKKRKRAFETLNQLSNFSLFLKFINKNNIYKT